MPHDPTRYGTHLALLIRLLNMTDGEVLELGSGIFSTPVVHWMCSPNKRKAITYDMKEKYYNFAKWYNDEYHKVILTDDWDKIAIEKPWDVVLVDHEADRRKIEAQRLANFGKFVILHDTGWKTDGYYGYADVYPLYKYRYDFQQRKPYTSVLSNFVDVTKIGLW